jgi:hypothetical protein
MWVISNIIVFQNSAQLLVLYCSYSLGAKSILSRVEEASGFSKRRDVKRMGGGPNCFDRSRMNVYWRWPRGKMKRKLILRMSRLVGEVLGRSKVLTA